MKKVTVWGDSIMKGVVLNEETLRYSVLGEKSCMSLAARDYSVEIDNRASFGMTSEKGKAVLERDLARGLFGEIGVIGFGGNDIDYNWAEIADNPSLPHDPNTAPAKFYQNLAEMVKDLVKNNIKPFIVNLPPICAKRYYAWVGKNLENRDNILSWLGDVEQIFRSHASYNEIVEKVARETGATLIDVRSLFLRTDDYSRLLCQDGIHPNAAGHLLMEKAIAAAGI